MNARPDWLTGKSSWLFCALINASCWKSITKVSRPGNYQELAYETSNTLPMLVAFRQALDGHLVLEDKQLLESIRKEYFRALDHELALSDKEAQRHNGPYRNEYMEGQWRASLRAMLPDRDLLRGGQLLTVLESLARKYAALLMAIVDLEKLRAVNLAARREFAVKNYEENGGMYGGFITVIREESTDSNLHFTANVLLLSPDPEVNLAEAKKRQPG
jgi:hypothetical protein